MNSPALWLTLFVVNFVLALGVVYVKHTSRATFVDIQQHRQIYQRLQTDWGRLLLEQSTLISHPRIEELATQQLQMHRPQLSNVIRLRP